ncbi:PTS mannose/fructose/sorbose/N-acetylgalactosamine transporter subunit IIC [Aerococcus loyolae]|uniref:PTS sugar transporter subunit IIC n=1 Tax=Aerococcus loyolae TaxID=2976809 RepID=A0ABT4BYX0_9LACT|nr:PTS sugar transporter subunit IIC [Aerococcus loyolae]MCY3024905.1 PTS sugar transporter subunit IIC [Aerococcus loyolae]MCY3027040.1 PTS sugar transporter subunit IIC [Aerococcus loyolae]MCY3028623.1 PTS sugar transporter subunit IIC [Aerococcus loyolae]OAM70575.1 hypothetical protein A1D21_02925 [Aerococcus loyolae]
MTSIFWSALLVAVAYFICFGGDWLIGQNMADQPIVMGPIVGLLLGDLHTGLVLGASLQAVFMGAVNVGGAVSLNPSFGTALAVAFTILSKSGNEVALVLAVPLGLLGGMMEIAGNSIASLFGDVWDKAAEENNGKKIVQIHYGVFLLKYIGYSLVIFLCVLAGADVVKNFVDHLPDFITSGLGVVAGLLPGVGFAVLLKMIWAKELAIYYFIGFILFTYLKLPLIVIAVIGIAIAIVIGGIDHRFNQLQISIAKGKESAQTSDEEEFLS